MMDFEQLKNIKKRIILFGAVENGRIQQMVEHGIGIERIIDNNPNKAGNMLGGVRVESASILDEIRFNDVLFIIMPERHIDDIEKQLKKHGISEYISAVKDIDEFSNPVVVAKTLGISTDKPMPTILNLELSGICNLKCVYCPFHGELNLKKEKGLMSWDTLKRIMLQIEKIETIDTLSVVGAGEVFCHPEWYEMIKYILDRLNAKKMCLYTNGILLNENNIKKIADFGKVEVNLEISIDGSTPEECDKYRIGANYDTIKENVKRAREELDENVKMTIFNLILAEEKDLVGSDYYIDQNNDAPDFLRQDFSNMPIISRKPNLDYRIKGEIRGFRKVEIRKKEPYPLCWNVYNRMAINYKGALLRCSCGCNGVVEIADSYKDNLLEVWKNDKQMNCARKHILDKSFEPDFCYGCELKGKDPYYVLVRV